MLTDLIIGKGEVGLSLGKVLERVGHTVYYQDQGVITAPQLFYGAIHVCIPYSDTFVDTVKDYMTYNFTGDLVIIHSTVEVGTTRLLGDEYVYSFVRGRHPHLEDEMTKFTKHIGGINQERVVETAKYLQDVGFTTRIHETPEAVELGKLWDTTYFGICIAATKLAKEMADHYGIDYQEIAAINATYNSGMMAVDQPQFVRPQLIPPEGRIGGHCVTANTEILYKTFKHPLIKAVLDV